MESIKLYCYDNPDGSRTISPVQPEATCTEAVRLVAAVGKLLTRDGYTFFPCVDTDAAEGWYQVEDAEATEADYLSALSELGVQMHEEN